MYDFVDASHPDCKNLLVTEAKSEGKLSGLSSVLSVRVSTCEIEFLAENGASVIKKMEFNLIDVRNNQILAKARLYGDKCECGVYKTHKIGKAQHGHSDWCGWKPKAY